MKINKRNFRKVINFKQLNNLKKGKYVYCVPRHKSKRKYDKTGTFDVHKYLGKNKKYIYLEDKEGVKWALENVYAGESGRKGLFPYYDEVKKPFNWNYEYILKIKEEDFKEKSKIIPKKVFMKKEKTKKVLKKEIPKEVLNKTLPKKIVMKKEISKKEVIKKYSVSGSWSKEESKLFIIQFFKFGNKWKNYNISTSRGIRLTSQVRSYAQKHSSKIEGNEVLKSATILHLLKDN